MILVSTTYILITVVTEIIAPWYIIGPTNVLSVSIASIAIIIVFVTKYSLVHETKENKNYSRLGAEDCFDCFNRMKGI